MQAAITEPRLLTCQRHQFRAQVLIGFSCLIAIAADRDRQQPADPALAGNHVLRPKPDRIRPSVYERSPFFRITACSISLSRLRSATSFRSRVFSSRSCLASCASLTSIPPYFAFQAYRVCFDTPTSRATSSALRPASICFKAPIICASVCLPLDINPPFPGPNQNPKSYSVVCGVTGACHRQEQNSLAADAAIAETSSAK